jgi:hypothetical protein
MTASLQHALGPGPASGSDGRRAVRARLQLQVPAAEPAATLTTAELAECTCPEFCERDHDLD